MLLGVTGGVAAYKACSLTRLLTRSEASVQVVMTRSATRFVGPDTFAALSGRRAHTDLWDEPGSVLHVRLAREAREVSGRDVFIAGAIGPLSEFEMQDVDEHGPLYAEQAQILEGRGVDLFMLETFFDLDALEIAVALAAEPRVVCHRDYHSRNLMVHGERLYMIDFQDARLGPDTYDLASLLRDSYVDISEREREELVACFLALSGIDDAVEFRRRFDLMSVQRNIKALGTFGFQASGRGNTTYIQYMPRTLQAVRENLTKHDRFARLHDLLGRHVEELR